MKTYRLNYLREHLKFACIFFIAMISLLILANGCSNNKSKVNLNFRITWEKESGRGKVIQNIVDQYNASQEEVYVQMVSGDEDRDTIITSLADEVIDVYVLPYRFLRHKTIQDYLISIDRQQLNMNTVPGVLNLGQIDGVTIGVPWIGHSMALIYNKTVTNQLGVYPESWTNIEDFIEGLDKIQTSSEIRPIGLVGKEHHDLSWMSLQFIYTFDGIQMNEQGQATYDYEGFKEGLEFYVNKLGPFGQEDWQNADGTDVMSAFINQEVAMEIQGPWGVTDVWKHDQPFEVGVIALKNFGVYSDIGPLFISIAQSSNNKDAAMDFADFLLSESAINTLLEGEYEPKFDQYYPFRIPISGDTSDIDFYTRYPEFIPFNDGFTMASISSPSLEWETWCKDLYIETVHKCINNEITIDEGMEDIFKCVQQY